MTSLSFIPIFFLLFGSMGCQEGNVLTGQIKVTIKDSKPVITKVTVENDQLIVTGKNLQDVTVAKVEGSTSHHFYIEAKTSGKLILNAKSALNFLVGQSLNLIVSHAHAAATFPISFELQNGQVTAAHLDDMGASSGQVLRFNGTNWAPANLANSQIYAGTYDAATDTPDIVTVGGASGTYYIVTTAGSQNLGSGMTAFSVGDWVIFNGISWEKIEVGANTVSNFNGRTGAVVPLSNDYSWSMLEKAGGKLLDSKISEIEDVDITGIQDGDILTWNTVTSKWEASSVPAPSITAGSITNTEIANSSVDSSKISDGSIVNADISATAAIAQSKIQNLTTDLNGKEPVIPTGTTLQYIRGDKTLGTLNTSVVPEGTNLYFTTTRVLGTALTGYATGTAIPITGLDTIPQAIGKLDAYIASLSGNQSNYVLLNGTSSMSGNLQMGNNKITGLATPTVSSDAVNKQYVDSFGQWGTSAGNVYRTSGNVGIGTSTPGSALEVAGQVKITGGVPGAGKILTSDATGLATWETLSVGLPADTAPSHLVRVATNANIALSGTQTIDGVVLAVGDRVLVKNQTAIAQNGVYVVSAGAWTRATDLNSWAHLLGYQAVVLEGSAQAGLRYSSSAGTIGTLGTSAIRFNSLGSSRLNENTAIGKSALNEISSGSDNIAIGAWSMGVATSAWSNTAVGNYSLQNLTTGNRNAAFGTDALRNNQDGYENTAVGNEALENNLSGFNNTALGKSALVAVTTGSGNLALGHNSGSSITTGSNNVVIGSNNGSTIAALSNNILISDGAGNLRMQVDSSGNLGIGAAASGGSKLEVAGQVKITGGTPGVGKVLTSDATGLASWQTLTAGGTVTNVTGTLPISVATGTTTPVVSISQANTTTNGYLSSTDWNTFNDKQAALSAGATINGIVFPTNGTQTLQIPLAPVNLTDAVNKQYVDSFGLWGTSAGNVYRSSGNVGIGTPTPLHPLHVEGPFLVQGEWGSGDTLAVSGAGTRMFFYPRKAAFRGGYTDTEWDDANIGAASFAYGVETLASGYASIAMGERTTASGNNSIAIGSSASASQDSAVAFSEGEASGTFSTAFDSSSASGFYSVAMGSSGASGDRAISMGSAANAIGDYTVAIGGSVVSNSFRSVSVGAYNLGSGANLTSWLATDPIFEIGNGTSDGSRSNAMTVLKNGNVGIGMTAPDERLVVYNGTTTGKYTASGWTHSSDSRLKHDISPLENSLEKIIKLRGVEYKFNSDPEKKTQVGFIAQEAEKIFPQVVVTDEKGFKSMIYANLVAPLVEAVKTLYQRLLHFEKHQAVQDRQIASKADKVTVDSKVQKLESENAKLKQENEEIKARLEKIEKALNSKVGPL